MKVELSIKDDKELRDLIKDMIRGTVTNIIRDEIKKMSEKALVKELDKKLKMVSDYEVRKYLHQNEKLSRDVSRAIQESVGEETEKQIFQKALSLLQRDNATIDQIVIDRMKKMNFHITP